ncbi:hypothetical protein AKJ48_00245 [candidate division MSBL1 archaeon SCGC-AAA261O19]|uniref:Ribbon-helix-helix protein CopG domain-containing protein n=1 Tax=candidate division MSBL1 archaeon SCGC-AAA261O19 TaxID=1698277 RepID=A0A133VFB0_9EURY|nr:hypothetical protein AKJ48_00245 [candidate division MSBL1 archaeon SCGC-AAA261O19]
MKVLTARVDEEIIKDLDEIGEEEKADRAEVARRLLDKAIKEWKLNRALEMISGGTWTMRRSADYAGLSYYQMLEEMSTHGVDSGPTLEDLRQTG